MLSRSSVLINWLASPKTKANISLNALLSLGSFCTLIMRDLTIIKWYIINLFTFILFFVANKTFNIFNLLSSKWPCGIDEQKLLPPISWGTKRVREVPRITQVSQGWECWNQNPGLVTFRANLLPGFFWVLVAFDMSQYVDGFHVLFFSFSLCLLIICHEGNIKSLSTELMNCFPIKLCSNLMKIKD